jgi:nitrogen fixation protein FixH
MKDIRKWPLLVTAALTFTVAANLVRFFAAGGDPNASVVEPDYYRKAVEWDSTMARRAASDRLGWSVEASIGGMVDGVRLVTVLLRDSKGMGVEGASVNLSLIHNLEASKPAVLTLTPVEGGTYQGGVSAPRPGRWEVRVEARRGDENFLATLHAEAP